MSHLNLNPLKTRLIPLLLVAERAVIGLIIVVGLAIFVASVLR